MTASMQSLLVRVAALMLVLVLVGCAVTRPSPVKQAFLLNPAAVTPVAKPQPGSLRVALINIAAPFRGRAFVYRTGELSFENDFYVEFLVAPAALLTNGTTQALQQARVFERVLAPGSAGESDWTLEGFVSTLYEDRREASKSYAELSILYYLSPSEGSSPVWSKEYHRRVPLSGASAQAYAAAMNGAFSDILGELARDIAAVDLKKM